MFHRRPRDRECGRVRRFRRSSRACLVSDVQRELVLDVQPTEKDQLKLFPVFVEQIYRHAFDGEGFFNGPHHLTEHLLEVQKRADGPRDMVMGVYLVQFFSRRSPSVFSRARACSISCSRRVMRSFNCSSDMGALHKGCDAQRAGRTRSVSDGPLPAAWQGNRHVH